MANVIFLVTVLTAAHSDSYPQTIHVPPPSKIKM